MPLFAILEHQMPAGAARGLHWDVMLERNGALATWASPPWSTRTVHELAEALADHRLAYLDYEGPVSGDRGDVTRIDRGEYTATQWDDDCICAILQGTRWRGSLRLTREDPGQRWLLEFVSEESPDASRSC
jgi:hypothetical protein